MTDVYVIRNQQGHYWAKAKLWVDGSDARPVLRAKHEDEAINILFELSSKDIDLRGEVIAAELSERGDPIIEPSAIPIPVEPEDDAEEEPEVADTDVANAEADEAATEPVEETPATT